MTVAFRALLGAAGSGEAPEPPTAYSLDFDGSNDMARVTDKAAFDISTGLTLEADCKPDSVTGTRTLINRSEQGTTSHYILRIENGKAKFYIWAGISFISATGATTIPTGQWVHLAGIHHGTSIKVYLNGVEDGSTSTSASIPAGTSPIRFGIGGTGVEQFDGKIANARVWNVDRSANLGAAINGSESGLVLAYGTSQPGTGTTWEDSSPNGYDATITGAVWSTDVP